MQEARTLLSDAKCRRKVKYESISGLVHRCQLVHLQCIIHEQKYQNRIGVAKRGKGIWLLLPTDKCSILYHGRVFFDSNDGKVSQRAMLRDLSDVRCSTFIHAVPMDHTEKSTNLH